MLVIVATKLTFFFEKNNDLHVGISRSTRGKRELSTWTRNDLHVEKK